MVNTTSLPMRQSTIQYRQSQYLFFHLVLINWHPAQKLMMEQHFTQIPSNTDYIKDGTSHN
jgi:hypothetical protein